MTKQFSGTIAGRLGTCVLLHAQALVDGASASMWLQIAPASGTGERAGPTGSGGLGVDEDGTHTIWLEVDD